MKISSNAVSHAGDSAYFVTNAPSGITVTHAYGPNDSIAVKNLNNNEGFGGGFFWKGGGAAVFNGWTGWGGDNASSRYLGFRIVCGWANCSNSAYFQVNSIYISATENSGPAMNAIGSNNLYYQGGHWVRGTWPISFQASDPSGVCVMWATIDGQTIYGPGATPDHGVWHQCPDETWSQSLNTANYGEGPMQLTLAARNAANVTSSPTTTIYVDNVAPSLSLSGPTDAPSTGGTQYLSAVATAGPSGVSGISCSLDNAPWQWYPTASARVPVQGIGVHHLTCYSANNARDQSGNLATSPPQTWTLSIRQPSVGTVSFTRVVDALRCRKTHERVHIPAHWVTATTSKGRPVRIRLPAENRTITVIHCHPRIVRRWVRVRGKARLVRVVVLPRRARVTTKRVPYGAGVTVSGWLGTTQGNALGGQRVRILTAPDNGQERYRQAAVALTARNGSWSARLRAGPSRLVIVAYDGAPTVEPTFSSPARLVVPASLTLAIHPQETNWGGTIRISGRLQGGYVPPAGELVVLWIGWPGGSTEIGHLYARRNGRFGSTYTFLRGNGSETYEIWAATARESDYPYAPGSSRRVSVTVNPG